MTKTITISNEDRKHLINSLCKSINQCNLIKGMKGLPKRQRDEAAAEAKALEVLLKKVA